MREVLNALYWLHKSLLIILILFSMRGTQNVIEYFKFNVIIILTFFIATIKLYYEVTFAKFWLSYVQCIRYARHFFVYLSSSISQAWI